MDLDAALASRRPPPRRRRAWPRRRGARPARRGPWRRPRRRSGPRPRRCGSPSRRGRTGWPGTRDAACRTARAPWRRRATASKAPMAVPSPRAAIEMRPPSRICRAWTKPSPTSPSRRSSETKQFSMITSAVSEARMPSLFSFLPGRKPSIPLSRTKAEMLWCRGALGVGHREDHADVADPAVGGEGLGAVQDPAAVDLLGAAAGAGGVRAGAGLGQAPGADLLAAGERHHPALPLLLVAELVDVVGAQRVVGGDADADRGVDRTAR